MGAQEHVDVGRVAAVLPLLPTVADIDALPDAVERVEEVRDAISFVPADDRQRLVSSLLADLDNDRAMSVMLARCCALPVDDIGLVAKELRELLERVVANHRQAFRAAEVALIVAVGAHAQNTQTAE